MTGYSVLGTGETRITEKINNVEKEALKNDDDRNANDVVFVLVHERERER